ncbi:MAG: sugar kinase [candidate division WS1 bacterium]|jgi:2-dehydro-3-deoxygluconokinase|nr:sugar kinase [candidate division WS1 bacterium]
MEVTRHTQIKPAESCRYDHVALGEVMLRLDPGDVPTARARQVRIFQGGGETNVACGLAYTFGLRTAVLTALVEDDIGKNIRNQLREAGVDTSHVIWFNTKNDGSRFSTDQKGGLMNGLNFTVAGKGLLPSETFYYRAHSAVRELRAGDVDWDVLFGQLGVRVFSTGGIYTLISPTSSGLALEGMQQAAEHGVFVAADLNYRSKVEPDRKRAREINRQIAPYLGFLVGNDSDLADALGYETHAPKGAPYDEWVQAYGETVRQVAGDYPNLSLIGTQWRGATNADMVSWGAVLFDVRGDKLHEATLREDVPIADRTGGGDSFASGVLAALLKGQDLPTAVQWGAAHGILVQETPGDITMIEERAVLAEVKRATAGGGVYAKR